MTPPLQPLLNEFLLLGVRLYWLMRSLVQEYVFAVFLIKKRGVLRCFGGQSTKMLPEV